MLPMRGVGLGMHEILFTRSREGAKEEQLTAFTAKVPFHRGGAESAENYLPVKDLKVLTVSGLHSPP